MDLENCNCQYLLAFKLPSAVEKKLDPLLTHLKDNQAYFLTQIPLLIQKNSKPIKRALFLLIDYYISLDLQTDDVSLRAILKKNFLNWKRNITYAVLRESHQFANDQLLKGIFERIICFTGPVSIEEYEVVIYERKTLRMKSTYFDIRNFEERVEELLKDCSTLLPQHYFLTKMTEQALTEEMRAIATRKFIQSQQNQLCKDILPILFPLQPQPNEVQTFSHLGTQHAKNITLVALLQLLICKIQPPSESNYFKVLLPLIGRCPEFAKAITPLVILKYAGSDPRMINDFRSSSSTGSSFSDRNLIPLTFQTAEKSKDQAIAQALGQTFLYFVRLHLNVNKKIAPAFRTEGKLRKLELPLLRALVKGKEEHVTALVLQACSKKELKNLVSFTQTLAILIEMIPLDSIIRGTTILPDKSLSIVLLEYKHFQHRATPSDTNLLEQIREIDEANSSHSALKSNYVPSEPTEIEVPDFPEINSESDLQTSLSNLDKAATTVPKYVQMVQESKQSSKMTQLSTSREYMTHPFPFNSLVSDQSAEGFVVHQSPSFLIQPKPQTIFERLNQLRNTNFTSSSGPIPFALNEQQVLEKKPAFSRILDLLTQIMFLVGGLIKQTQSSNYLADLEIFECIQKTIQRHAEYAMQWLCQSSTQRQKELYSIFLTILEKILYITGTFSRILSKKCGDSRSYDQNMFDFSEKELQKNLLPLSISHHIQNLMKTIEECEQSFDVLYFLNTCYFLLFKALDRKQEAAIFLRELVSLHLKHKDEIPMFTTATQDLMQFQDHMIEFELYQAIIIKQTGLVNDVLGVLTQQILAKILKVESSIRNCAPSLKPYLQYYFDRDIYRQASLLRLEVLSRSYYKDKDKIFTKEVVGNMRNWSEFNFFYAKILDEVNQINSPMADLDLLNRKDRLELAKRCPAQKYPPLQKIKLKIRFYVQACIGDDRYIMSGLGRALQIYFDTLLHPQFWQYHSQAEKSAEDWIHLFQQVPIYKYCPLVTQLLYRLNQFDAAIKVSNREGLSDRMEELWKRPLRNILTRILNEYPNQNLWWFMSLLLRDVKGDVEITGPDKLKKSSKTSSQFIMAETILQNLKKDSKVIVSNALPFFRALLTFSMKQCKDEKAETPTWLLHFKNMKILMPCDQFIQPRLSNINQANRDKGIPLDLKDSLYPPEDELVYIHKVDRFFSVIRSKEFPKKFSMLGSDGKKYDFLLKNNVSSRASNQKVAMSFIRAVNTLLSQDTEAVRFNLNLKCFSIVPVGASGMIIEWVKGLCSLKDKIVESAHAEGVRLQFHDIRMMFPDKQNPQCLGEKWDAIMKISPPSLHNFLLLDFHEPRQLRKAIIMWTKQLACWSYVGYFLGFGDRHCDNILIDIQTAELMHVDFECVMDKGTTLPVPEIVPFRMTKNLASPLGAASFNGLFKDIALTVIKVIRRNAAVLATIINTFKGTEVKDEGGHDSKGVMIACKRLLGKDAPMDMKDHATALVPFSEEEQFKNAIMVATSPLNLKKMYTGWMPWL